MRSFLALLLGLFLSTACSSADPVVLTDAGMKALRSGDHVAAAERFAAALQLIGQSPGHPEFKRARMGAIQAALEEDPKGAKEDFLALHELLGKGVTDIDYQRIASALGVVEAFDQGIELLVAGKAAFPNSPHLDRLGTSLARKSREVGNVEAANKLKGLGYL